MNEVYIVTMGEYYDGYSILGVVTTLGKGRNLIENTIRSEILQNNEFEENFVYNGEIPQHKIIIKEGESEKWEFCDSEERPIERELNFYKDWAMIKKYEVL